jgi:hypothetical protein
MLYERCNVRMLKLRFKGWSRLSPEQIPQSQARKRNNSVFLFTLFTFSLCKTHFTMPFIRVLRAWKYLIHPTEKAILPDTIWVTGKTLLQTGRKHAARLCSRRRSDHAGIAASRHEGTTLGATEPRQGQVLIMLRTMSPDLPERATIGDADARRRAPIPLPCHMPVAPRQAVTRV